MDIYVKPSKKAKVTGRKIVYLRDIADVYSPSGKTEAIQNAIVLQISGDKKSSYLVTILDIIKAVSNVVENATVNNVGEKDVVVEYSPRPEKYHKSLDYMKVFVIAMVLLFGSATAIMSFNSDAQMARIFHNFYTIFFNESAEVPYLLHIPYAIGLAVGIMVFFNHFSKIYVTKDPTPIEVQMTTYEQQTIASVVDALGRQKQDQKKKDES